MSSEGFKFQASVKDNDGDMVNVRADSAEELGEYLSNFPVAEYAQFKANVRGGAALGQITHPQGPLAQGSGFGGGDRGVSPPVQQEQPAWAWSQPRQQAAPQQPQGWGAAQQQSAPPQQQYGGGGSKFAGPPHPEGKQCEMCGKVLEFKKTSTGKGTWRCPEWRWNNGTPNGHTSEFAN